MKVRCLTREIQEAQRTSNRINVKTNQTKNYTWVYHIETSENQPGLVAHACNPSYLGGRDWEDNYPSKSGGKSSQDPISINKNWVWW
jgi:hypothetical protein